MLSDMIDILFDGPDEKSAKHTLILAHGAGAPMDSGFMNVFAAGIGERGIRVARFEFPYMDGRRVTGKKRPPDRQPKLLETWREVITQIGGSAVNIGGKSMGGRMATLLAVAEDVPAGWPLTIRWDGGFAAIPSRPGGTGWPGRWSGTR